jgi:hypothetical protein
VLAIGLVALFNYLTRVADGTGIEPDYETELPQFAYRGVTESVDRPEPAEWPPVDRSIQLLSVLPDVHAAWSRWRDYVLKSTVLESTVLESTSAIPSATRHQLRVIAARNACDRAVVFDETEHNAAESLSGPADTLARFAEKLSRTPWLMASSDVEALRSLGMDDRRILHVIAVVGYQSAESRLRIGLSAVARSED